jgi:hypothetical protein
MTRVGQAIRAGAVDPSWVSLRGSPNEIVLFEISGPEYAAGLCELLATDRLAWTQTRDGVRHVGVLLQPTEGDLAALLRSVEGWIAERGLVAIRFQLDGRTYVLRAAEAGPPTVPA